MTLSFDDYQQRALTTAVYPKQYVHVSGDVVAADAPSCIYPVFGLCGEAGEVAQALNNKLGQTSELSSECGDVLWYVAAICSDLNLDMRSVAGSSTFNEFSYRTALTNNVGVDELLVELLIATGIVAESTKKTIRDSKGIVSPERLKTIVLALRRVMIAISAICERRSISFEAVAQNNLAKLSSRKESGTLCNR